MVNEQVTTIELTAGTPSTVEFSGAYPYYWVDNRSAGDVYASLGTPEAGTDGTYTIAAGSQLRISGGAFNTKLCLLGSGKVQVIASGIASCPFKGAQGGGDYAVAGASSYTLNNAVDYPLLGMNLYGKSMQDGVPTPEAPVDIVSVGDSGSVKIKTCGKNLYEGSQDWSGAWISNSHWETADEKYLGLTVKKRKAAWTGISKLLYVEAGKTYTFSCFARADAETSATIYAVVPSDKEATALPNDCWKTITISTEWTRYNIAYNCQQSGYIKPRLEKRTTDDIYLYLCGYQLEVSNTATNYEPYKDTTANITTALPLCGIPVDSGGNYTDSNGQQWICDELIYNADGTGKIIKNIRKYTFTGTEEGGIWQLNGSIDSTKNRFQFKITDENIKAVYDTSKFTSRSESRVLCNKYQTVTSNDTWTLKNGIAASHTAGYIAIYDENYATISTINDWIAYLAENPVTVIYQLNKPQEIELTAAEMAQLRELQTFDGVSNITNGSGADMDVKVCTNKALSEYVKPIITGLQAQIDELKAAVLSLGGNV